MRFPWELNIEQKRMLVSFFTSISVAWVVAIFATPTFGRDANLLTLFRYTVNMIITFCTAIVIAGRIKDE